MDSMPGLAYQIASALLMIALYSFVWIDLNARSGEREKKRKQAINETYRKIDMDMDMSNIII